ncbi:MAG: 3-phosphoshikimate 1-carboxyvinyltransferase [Salibacteraceae bacterium]
MKFVLRAKTHTLRGNIKLPASKSISNRMLIIKALAQRPVIIHNLSEADDTKLLREALDRNNRIIDIGPAGTAMRFLTAYYACTPGERILTGNDRMRERPIAPLVNALVALGAKITYLEKHGYPPLHIEGRRLSGGEVKLTGEVSSQFITALMLIGPVLPTPLHIAIEGRPLSRPYIVMTSELMRKCGAQVEMYNNRITILPGRYRASEVTIEYDWSAVGFWLSFVSLSRNATLHFPGLTNSKLQGDSSVTAYFAELGVHCEMTETGMKAERIAAQTKHHSWNFRDHPDLVQAVAFACAGLGHSAELCGLDNLRLKETDRIAAIIKELGRIGVEASSEGHKLIYSAPKILEPTTDFETYGDHRMAMSVAPLSLVFPEIGIKNPMVTDKSYPGFWREVEKFIDVKPTMH